MPQEQPEEQPVPRVHPAHIHAFETLGYLVTTATAGLFTADQLAEWDTAVAEGETIHGPVQDASE